MQHIVAEGKNATLNRRFWIYLGGRTISALGDGMSTIAMVWLVYALTGSKLAMGSLYMTGLIPQVVIRLIGAPLLDRINRFRLMVAIDIILFLSFLSPLLLSLTGNLAIWHLYAIEFISGAVIALYAPAAAAAIPALVDSAQLVRANSLLNAFMQGARVSGPIVAGILIKFTTAEVAMALDGITFAISAASLSLLPAVLGQAQKAAVRTSYLQQMTDGFRFFRRVPELLTLTLIYGLTYMSAIAIFTMHVPYAQEHLQAGAEAAGFLQGSWPAGFLLGSLATGYIGARWNRRSWMLTGLTATGLALAGLGLVAPGYLPVAMLLKGVEGFGFAMFSNTFSAIFQAIVPNAMRGRASAAQMLISWGGNPIGAFLGAYLSEQIGIGTTFLLMGGLPALTGMAAFAVPRLRAVDQELRPLEEAL